MTRLRADILLLAAALIWGLAFVAQKGAMAHVGACTFVAARFFLSFLVVLPLALREKAKPVLRGGGAGETVLLCAVFSVSVLLQQWGVAGTSVTNAGFLTGLYVLFVPVICRFIYGRRMSPWIFPAALASVCGIWLLSGGDLVAPGAGDLLVLGCAAGFALHIVLLERVLRRAPAPLRLSCLQYAVCAAVAAVPAFLLEAPSWPGLLAAAWPVLYAGVVSGGIAYTLQAVAQQHAPPADAAVILSAEAVFAALGGAMLMGEEMTAMKLAGCALITAAILTVVRKQEQGAAP